MEPVNLQILGGAWMTASGVGQLFRGDEFSMPDGELPALRRQLFSDQPDSRWGRMDRYSKVGVIAASLALQDAGIGFIADLSSIAVVVSTATGSLEVDRQYYETVLQEDGLLASPNLFAYTLPNCLLGEIAIRYNLTGPAMVVDQGGDGMLDGLIAGARCIQTGLSGAALAGYCDVGQDPDGKLRPGAAFLLMRRSHKPTSLVFENDTLVFKGSVIGNLIEWFETMTTDVNTRILK